MRLSARPACAKEDKTDEGCKLYLKFVETMQLLALWGLRKFQVHVRSPHFSCCFCPHSGLLYHFSQDMVQPNSKRLYLLFVDPLGLISGTSHKVLRGKDEGRWIETGEPGSGSLLKPQADCQSDQNESKPFKLFHFPCAATFFFRLLGEVGIQFVKYLCSSLLI